jgi:DNA-binding HxlR family transcriptional regulator
VQQYGQFCPVALGAEIFAERWTPLILRELLLVQRLAYLEQAGLLERRRRPNGRGFEYHLTAAGEELRPVVVALGTWGYKWTAQEIKPYNLDAGLLMWFLRRRVQVEELPSERIVARFDFHEGGPRSFWLGEEQSFWLVLERPEVELCLSDPGFGVDLHVRADVAELTRVYLGQIALAQALRTGSVQLTGSRELRSGFRKWLGISPFAEKTPRARRPVAAAAS